MPKSEFHRRFPRTTVLVVGEFGPELAEVRALRGFGARVEAAGIASEPERGAMQSLGIDVTGIGSVRELVLDAALDRLGGADVVLFGAGDWEAERKEIFEIEREQAAQDGRSLLPLVSKTDERYAFLRSPAEWAAFVLARGAGAACEAPRDFAAGQRPDSEDRGHKTKNHQPGGGARRRAAGARSRKTR